MSEELFETTLRKYLRSQPFQPFQVELADGNVILIEEPALAFAAGAASMLTQDDRIIEFFCEDVSAIRPTPAKALS